MFKIRLPVGVLFFCLGLSMLNGCGSASLSYSTTARMQLVEYPLQGDTDPVHDPSFIHQGMYYAFTSDPVVVPAGAVLPIRCSPNQVVWAPCGSVFAQVPAWLKQKVPGVGSLWAPDVSFFNGLYHVYYAASTAGSQRSVIALATNTTLDQEDPDYAWVDRGEVLESQLGMDFNAIDPNVLVDVDGSVWMTYGSYWSGIKQMQLDPESGLVMKGAQRYDLASRPDVTNDPIEGASLVHHGAYYYLFFSVDTCCAASLADDNYKQAVGRGTTPHGPFFDEAGTALLQGGGTVLLEGNGVWNAPGGGTASFDPQSGEWTLAFHALNMQQNGVTHLWIKSIDWTTDWPVLQPAANPRAELATYSEIFP